MDRVIVVDDDYTQLILVQNILTKENFEVVTYSDPKVMYENYNPGDAEVILSDIVMPGISGIELVSLIREKDLNVPFIMFTATRDIKSVINLFKKGVSDYLIKPVVAEDLIYRVKNIIQNVKRRKDLHRIGVEKELVELENKKLISWKNLYASKDIKQTKQMMEFFSRSINAGGGYLWLDFLSKVKPNEDGSYTLDKDLYQLIMEAATSQRKAFDFISYIIHLPEFEISEIKTDVFQLDLIEFCDRILKPLVEDEERDLSLNINSLGTQGVLNLNSEKFHDIILELVINSIKFSPEKTKIIIEVYKEDDHILFKVRNKPKEGDRIGIPYDYSELVFDLFYTMESYLTTHKNEKWSHGTGLYIARNFGKRMGLWIECGNMVDYTTPNNENFVQFKITLPIK